MSAIHELREDFRRYRFYHPQYRLLFWLLDILMFVFQLALFGGFLALCWYIMSRNPASPSRPLAAVSAPAIAVEEVVTPELTDERIALLKSIAEEGLESTSGGALNSSGELLGSYTTASGLNDSKVLDSSATANLNASTIVTVAARELPGPTPVQVESAAAIPVTPLEVVPQDQVPASDENFTDAQDGQLGTDWVLTQTPEYYTVQLALTVNRPFLVQFAKDLPSEFTTAIYPERVNSKGGTQYSLSVGNFPDKAGAEKLLAGLSTYNRRFGAHLRTFGEIQQNVANFKSKTVR